MEASGLVLLHRDKNSTKSTEPSALMKRSLNTGQYILVKLLYLSVYPPIRKCISLWGKCNFLGCSSWTQMINYNLILIFSIHTKYNYEMIALCGRIKIIIKSTYPTGLMKLYLNFCTKIKLLSLIFIKNLCLLLDA